MPETVFTWQCHSSPEPIPKKCWIGDKRIHLHNQYISAMAGCTNGFEAHPQIDSSPDATLCAEEATCVKSFAFVKPDCNEELPGSVLVKETCQDKIGGMPFGYSWGLNAPRERECPASGEFASSLAQRCCVDGVSFCSTVGAKSVQFTFDLEETSPTPMPIPVDTATFSPTASNKPSWNGFPVTVLIQLDEFPHESALKVSVCVEH